MIDKFVIVWRTCWQVLKVSLFTVIVEDDTHEAVESSPIWRGFRLSTSFALTSWLRSSRLLFEFNSCLFYAESIDEKFYAKEKENLKNDVVKYTRLAVYIFLIQLKTLLKSRMMNGEIMFFAE